MCTHRLFTLTDFPKNSLQLRGCVTQHANNAPAGGIVHTPEGFQANREQSKSRRLFPAIGAGVAPLRESPSSAIIALISFTVLLLSLWVMVRYLVRLFFTPNCLP
jgi:hypothetical protein